MPSKKETIKLLENIADMLELKGENKFKVQAYRTGANSLQKTNGDFDKIITQRELNKIKGIGQSLQKVIYEFYTTNKSSIYKELRNDIPDGLEQLIKIKGLNPGKIKQLYSELKIKNIDDLEKAAKNNLLVNLKGFGDSLQNKILSGLKDHKKYRHFIHISKALGFSKEILDKLSSFKSVEKIEKTGELRRGCEIFSQLDFIVLTYNKTTFLKGLDKIFNFFISENKITIEDHYDIPVFIYIVENKSRYYKQLFLTTGSDEFIDLLEVEKIKGSTEEDIFLNRKFPFIIPEMREKEYFEQKKKNLLKNSTLSIDDFNGLLHFHTTYSDGKNSLSEMAQAADELNFKYAAVNDHSKSAYYANGLDEKRIHTENEEVKNYTLQNRLYLFMGNEVDILANGDLDFSNEFLPTFDFIIASIHSRFNLEEAEMTKRMIKAIENPFVDVLAHPSGRQLLSRAPYKFDKRKIIDACSANNVAIEINSSPRRLDLEWRWVYYAREKGCLFSINPDAHSISEISYLLYGIMMARKAGIQPKEVINCFSLNKFKKFLNRKVKRDFEMNGRFSV
jgi:DNA polymerase (family X)